MIKNNKGVSLVTLVITIVVMLIIIAISFNSSLNSVNEANITKVENEMKTLKDAIRIRMANYERDETVYPLVGEKMSEFVVLDYLRSIDEMYIKSPDEIDNIINTYYSYLQTDISKTDYYRLIGSSEAAALNVESISSDNYYIANYLEGDVYGPISSKLVNNGG